MKRDNQLMSVGGFALAVGALAFFPPIFNYELMVLSWLGGMAQPVGLSAMIIGGILYGLGRLQEMRNAPVVGPPVEPDAAAAPGTTMPTVQPNVLSNQAPTSPGPADRR